MLSRHLEKKVCINKKGHLWKQKCHFTVYKEVALNTENKHLNLKYCAKPFFRGIKMQGL